MYIIINMNSISISTGNGIDNVSNNDSSNKDIEDVLKNYKPNYVMFLDVNHSKQIKEKQKKILFNYLDKNIYTLLSNKTLYTALNFNNSKESLNYIIKNFIRPQIFNWFKLDSCKEYKIYLNSKSICYFNNLDNYSLCLNEYESTQILEEINNNELLKIEIRPILKGGNALGDLIIAIGSIGELFVFAYKGITYIVKLFIWAVEVLIWIMKELANPNKLITEFGTTITTLMFSLVYGPFMLIYHLMKYFVNMFDRTVFNGFLGMGFLDLQ